MDNLLSTAPGKPCVPDVLAVLEHELAKIDLLGAHIAAAHLDAAIQQLRLDQTRR